MTRDPFAYCQRHGIRIVRTPHAFRRWLTFVFLDELYVCVSGRLSAAAQRAAVAEALLAHPTLEPVVSRS